MRRANGAMGNAACGHRQRWKDQPASAQDGEHTICDLPSSLRAFSIERVRCLPHRKHDIVLAPNAPADAKGEPDTLLR